MEIILSKRLVYEEDKLRDCVLLSEWEYHMERVYGVILGDKNDKKSNI